MGVIINNNCVDDSYNRENISITMLGSSRCRLVRIKCENLKQHQTIMTYHMQSVRYFRALSNSRLKAFKKGCKTQIGLSLGK